MSTETVSIQVVYALPDRQAIVQLNVERGTTVAQAVELSRLMQRFPEITASPLHCAVFSRVVPQTHPVASGDRVEILRPLLIDPKENRRQAAARAKRKRA